MHKLVLFSALCSMLAACSSRDEPVPYDAGGRADAGAAADAAMTGDAAMGGDAAVVDAGARDAAGADAGRPGDGGARDAGVPGDGGPCTIVGDFSLTFMGTTVYFRFAADGTWRGSPTLAGLATSPDGGTYTVSGATFTIRDTSAGGCAPSDEGVYTLSFDAGCGGVTLTQVSEACAERGMTLAGAHFTRVG